MYGMRAARLRVPVQNPTYPSGTVNYILVVSRRHPKVHFHCTRFTRE